MRDASLKAAHNLPYADCFAAAVAQVAPTPQGGVGTC